MKRLAVFFLTLFVSVNAIHATVINNIEYILSMADRTAIVDSYFRNNLGKVVIPEEVMFEGYTFTVIGINDYAFKDCSSLTSVTIPNTVKSIGNNAFLNCSSLTSVTIGNGVKSIGAWAFQGCSSLTSITFPNSVTSIETRAFHKCSSLTSVTIPNTITDLGDAVFTECTSLATVYIDSHVILNNRDNYMYTNSNNMSKFFGSQVVEYIIGKSVKRIGDYAFYGCPFTSVTISNSVTSIGKYAFYGCSRFTSITIPKMVTFIGDAAFSTCWNLTNVTLNSNTIACKEYTAEWNLSHIFGSQVSNYVIGDEVTHIGSYAFCSCEFLTSLIIPNSVTSIGEHAFYSCSKLTSVTIPNSVTSIGDGTFSSCSSLTSVTIPNSVTSIGSSAFEGCKSLTSITIPNSVTSIGSSAFEGCKSLTSITIPNSVTSIGEYAFYGCSGLISVTIPNSVTSIGEKTFYNCSSLTSVTIPNSVTSIGEDAFYQCTSMTSVTIPESVTSIGAWAFEDCSKLTSITIPNSVTSIENGVFYQCTSMTSVTIPESVTSIGIRAFEGCSSLTSVTIPNSVTSIGYAAFKYCSSLTSVTIPNSVTSIGEYAFYGCSGLISVTIPNSITRIEEEAFGGCKDLTSVIIPDNVTYIGESAFAGCSNLDTITIGNGVKQIKNHAFYNCSTLAYVICKATKIPSTATDAFDLPIINAFPSATLYVPKASIDKYKSTEPWKYFNLILPIEDSGEDPSNPDDEEDVGALTCAEAVAICQETGTTITTEQYTIRGYVTEIKTAYSEQYNNITFWMADIPNGGKVLQAYRVIPVEANDIDVKVGDYVEVIGSLVNYYGTTPEVYTGGIYTILPKQEENGSTTEEEYITACDSYEWHGETYTESGDYTYTTTTENGCEHVEILHLTIYKSEYVETSITACDSYEWHGETYTESGDYTYTTTTENGCERVEILHLMITPSNPEDNSKDSITVKAKIPAHWTDDISAWIWGATSSGHWVTPTKEDDWYVITEDVEELNIIFVNGTNWSGYKNQTIDMTFTANACIQLAQEGSAKATYTAIDCESNDTPKDDEEDDGVITCAEAVAICQETGTTITTEQYTIRGYVTEIKTAYSEQYNNITFWMADISPTQMDNSSNSVTSLSDYPNIVLGKSTTASSSEDSGTLPEYINDGDFNTRWSSEWQDNEYITIDLEQYSFIDHITLHWETAYASQFAILITDEQPSSSALSSPLPSSATYYQSSGDVQTIPVAKSGRYITLIGIERATAYGISLYELEAYGMPLLQAYCVKPIQSTDKYVQIGDYVEAVGTLVNYGGTTPEINAGGTYTILTKHEENGSTTSVENTNTQSSMTNCQKILYEDHIYILREDKIYSVMGQEL